MGSEYLLIMVLTILTPTGQAGVIGGAKLFDSKATCEQWRIDKEPKLVADAKIEYEKLGIPGNMDSASKCGIPEDIVRALGKSPNWGPLLKEVYEKNNRPWPGPTEWGPEDQIDMTPETIRGLKVYRMQRYTPFGEQAG